MQALSGRIVSFALIHLRFLTKEERVKEALRKRQAQVEEQRRAQDEERRKREQFDRDGRRELREAEREARDRDRSVNTKDGCFKTSFEHTCLILYFVPEKLS